MKSLEKKVAKMKNRNSSRTVPVSLKLLNFEELKTTENVDDSYIPDPEEIIKFPYSIQMNVNKVINSDEIEEEIKSDASSFIEDNTDFKIPLFENHQIPKSGKKWMNDYEKYTEEEVEENGFETWRLNYGTADPKQPVSRIPCGGCGALLHCQDPSIPGYLPSEIFLQCKTKDLLNSTCQRCHFMKNYNTALAVNVDKELYPKLVAKIKGKNALVMLMVDLTDFPCSIWPGILDIIGRKHPVFIIGNKIDLLWGDCRSWIDNVKNSLKLQFPIDANIKEISLISAKTGFGVEELINKVHNIWQHKGDVYLVGCTNVGKSTLFNALLQSDLCQVKAADLMQRATTSPWPGTTLNLIKFPLLRPEGWRLYLRTVRLLNEKKKSNYEENIIKKLKKSTKTVEKSPPQLIGHIGRTFSADKRVEDDQDHFSSPSRKQLYNETVEGSGLDLNDKDFTNCKWFYDTPGVVHSDHILDLLTTEEIMLTVSKKILKPRTFLFRPGWSVFIGGLARLDYTNGESPIRITIFSSEELPITICKETNALQVYNDLLGTEYMVVPQGTEKRLKEWPNLSKTKQISLIGVNEMTSCADIILSSAGWISVTIDTKKICKFLPWTPLARGVHIRNPSLLPNAVNLRGKKLGSLPAYSNSKKFLE